MRGPNVDQSRVLDAPFRTSARVVVRAPEIGLPTPALQKELLGVGMEPASDAKDSPTYVYDVLHHVDEGGFGKPLELRRVDLAVDDEDVGVLLGHLAEIVAARKVLRAVSPCASRETLTPADLASRGRTPCAPTPIVATPRPAALPLRPRLPPPGRLYLVDVLSCRLREDDRGRRETGRARRRPYRRRPRHGRGPAPARSPTGRRTRGKVRPLREGSPAPLPRSFPGWPRPARGTGPRRGCGPVRYRATVSRLKSRCRSRRHRANARSFSFWPTSSE